jgi:LPXTG-motif cell wall-anchored protein
MDNNTLILLGLVALVVIALVIFLVRRRKSAELRDTFGPEYTHAVERHGSVAKAESELAERQKRVAKLELRPLPEADRRNFAAAWRDSQARFVDSPGSAIKDADRLVKELMQARGYPMGDFEQRAADISVDHPRVVESYRAARAIAQANERGEATTENLREAMVHYRTLFLELLEDPAAVETAREAEREVVEPTGARR